MKNLKHFKNKNKTDIIIQIVLFVIIGIWLGFTLLTTIWPQSIEYLETQGMKSESMNLKELGDNLLAGQNFKLAAGQYIEAVRLDPKNNAALTNLAICYTQLELYEKAIVSLQGLLKNKPKQTYIVYYNLGEVYFKQGNLDNAQLYFKKSTESNPFPMDAFLYLARTHKEKREWGNALKTFRTCLKYIPDMESTYLGTIKELQMEFSGNMEDSLNVSQILNEYKGKDELFDRFDSSVFDYQKDNKKRLSNIYNDIGFVYAQLGEKQKAIENINYALKLDPSSITANNNLKFFKSQEN